MGPQLLGEARSSLGAPHPSLICCGYPRSTPPSIPATEGWSCQSATSSGPTLPPLLGFEQHPSADRVDGGGGGFPSSARGNRCVAAAEACTADARCQQLRTEYVAQCLGRAAPGGCPRARCHRALRHFFARGPPALTLALLFCPCASPACAERRRQTFVPACAFSGPGPAPPSCLAPLEACEHSGVCRPRLRAFQASCASSPVVPDGCPLEQAPSCRRAYAGLVGTAVTPNYVDNASARVAPWCDCGASGNRREECEAFRGLFTRNRCLDRAIQAFESWWPPTLQNPHQDPEHSLLQLSSADQLLERCSLLFILPALALWPLL
ncbi:GDNF family receptor alpha-4 [Trichechus manatus latirostris]|uniref:GDNF family receptor alpha-4 n=1 Tax=Trichechus manatus latirostris TaxID=127582 RepID=A0A2Y9DYR3_TRIMA|nr:GDNF family receptor alpha-4 [Trichechus manatus latirostris]